MEIEYEKLRGIAASSMFEQSLAGLRPTKRRRKPRDPEKIQLLLMKSRNVADKFPPSRLEDGSLELPFFSRADLA